MNPDRLQPFAEAFAPAVLQAEVDLSVHMVGKTPQQHALDTTLLMLDMIQAGGIDSVSHYVIVTRGGALRRTAESLGIDNTTRALQDYLDGRTP
jgi:hypothetical protein